MKKLIIYPYDRETTPIVRYKDLLQAYELVGAVGPKGWGLHGKAASEVDGGEALELVISEEFNEALENCEAVLFVEGNTKSLLKAYGRKINLALEQGKEVLLTEGLKEKLLLDEAQLKQMKVIKANRMMPSLLLEGDKKLYSIKTPIIGVLGAGEYCNKFEIQLALRDQFIKSGYKVSQVGTKKYDGLFGINGFPEFMFENEVSMTDKIISFNHYIHEIECEENPDVIIIGIPGGIMPLNKKWPNHFGEIAYLVGNAVQMDLGILSVYYLKNMTTKYLDRLANYCQVALQCPVKHFNIANCMCEIDHQEESLNFIKIENSKIAEFMSEHREAAQLDEKVLFNTLKKEEINKLYESVIETLSKGISQVM